MASLINNLGPMLLCEADRFLKALGFLKGVPTLIMPKTGEKLEKR